MNAASGRLSNYLTDQFEECAQCDVDERVDYLTDLASDPESVTSDVRAFAALANETRYEILRVLDRADEELCVCELNVTVDASESTISQSLSKLVDVGLVTRRKDGRWRKYQTKTRATALLATFDGLKDAE